jgi:hypothetical protein
MATIGLFNNVDATLGATIGGVTASLFSILRNLINQNFNLVAIHFENFGAKIGTDAIATPKIESDFTLHFYSS